MNVEEYRRRMAQAAPHGPDEPCTCTGCWACTCTGCWACTGGVVGCTCDIDWDALTELRLDRY